MRTLFKMSSGAEEIMAGKELNISAATSLMAGTYAGMVSVLISHPVDTVKVRQQSLTSNNLSALQNVKSAITTEGIFSLYKGLVAPLLGSGILNAVIFATYDSWCQKLLETRNSYNGTSETTNSHAEYFCAGSLTGFAQAFVASPFERIKIILQNQTTTGKFRGPRDILRGSSMRTLYHGLGSTMGRDFYSYGVYFQQYQYWREALPQNHLTYLIAGGVAGSLSWTSCYPVDVVKSRIQADTVGKYKSFFDCAKKSYQEEGITVFGRGYFMTILRAFIVNSVTFYSYEQAVAFLKKRDSKWTSKNE